jgi:hypothetical protein
MKTREEIDATVYIIHHMLQKSEERSQKQAKKKKKQTFNSDPSIYLYIRKKIEQDPNPAIYPCVLGFT